MEQTQTKENIMGTMSEGRLLLKLAMPMIFSVLVSSLYNIVDSIFVGRIGQNALTAISLGAPASSLMVELSFGVAVGAGAMLSRKLGEKDSDGVSRAAGQGFLLIGAVYVIYNRVRSFVALPVWGIRNTIISVVAYNMGAGYKERVRKLIKIAMTASAGIMVIGTILYETIPALLLRIFSATDEMLAIGIPAFRIIGITAIISGMTIMMSGVFQAMNNSSKALIVSIVQAVTLVGSAALLALTHNTSVVWFAFPVSEIVIFLLSIIFLRGIYRKYLGSDSFSVKPLNSSASSDIM